MKYIKIFEGWFRKKDEPLIKSDFTYSKMGKSKIDLSKEIQRAMNQSDSKITFIVGSAYGIDDSLKKRANLMLSFSKFTFTHQMIRLMLVEQIYRSMTILKGESYHHA